MAKYKNIAKFRNILNFAHDHKAARHDGVCVVLPLMLVVTNKKTGKSFTLHTYLKKWANSYMLSHEIYLTDYEGNHIGVNVDWNRETVSFYPA